MIARLRENNVKILHQSYTDLENGGMCKDFATTHGIIISLLDQILSEIEIRSILPLGDSKKKNG